MLNLALIHRYTCIWWRWSILLLYQLQSCGMSELPNRPMVRGWLRSVWGLLLFVNQPLVDLSWLLLLYFICMRQFGSSVSRSRSSDFLNIITAQLYGNCISTAWYQANVNFNVNCTLRNKTPWISLKFKYFYEKIRVWKLKSLFQHHCA